MHDALILLGMLAADAAILTVWWFLGSRLVPASRLQAPDTRPAAPLPEAEPRLHRVLTAAALVLLTGLIVECSGLMAAILVVFGWS